MIKHISQWVLFLLSLLVLAGVVWLTQQQIHAQAQRRLLASENNTRPRPQAATPATAPTTGRKAPSSTSSTVPEVSVVRVQAASHPAYISAYAAVEPHYQLDLTAQVSGQVQQLNAQLASGQRVAKDAVLLQLEDSSYRSALADAQATLAEARLAYEQEQQQSKQAQQEWQASGLAGQPSRLVLRKPQLAAAKAQLERATVAVETARLNLRRTQVRAPFDAVVMSRNVALGSYVQANTTLATLYSTDWVEIPLYLSEREWAQLPSAAELQAARWPVTLHSALSEAQWTGRVLRQAQHLDAETRLRGLIVGLDAPLDQTPALLPGAFVKADLQGRQVDGVWQLPASALSQQGEVWYVDHGALAQFATEPLFSDAQRIYIHPPAALATQPQQVLVHPLNAYVPGMAVKPVEIAE